CGDADFIKPVVGCRYQHMTTAKPLEHFHYRINPYLVKYTHYLIRRTRWIGQRSEHVKNGAHTNLTTRANHVFHCAMMTGGKHKPYSYLLYALRYLGWRYVQTHTCGLKQVGATAFAGGAAVSVLGHTGPGTGSNHCSGSGNIECVRTGTTGTAGIHQVLVRRQNHRCSQFTHGARRAQQLGSTDALDLQGNQKSCNLRISGLTGHDFAHQPGHQIRIKILACTEVANSLFDIHVVVLFDACRWRYLPSRKFRNSW